MARQQCQGRVQLPEDCGVVALDYRGEKGIVLHRACTASGSGRSGCGFGTFCCRIADQLSCGLRWQVWIVYHFCQLDVALPLARRGRCPSYTAVKALSDFCCALQINVPTGKDSLSMTQVSRRQQGYFSGTVIVSAGERCPTLRRWFHPVMVNDDKSSFYHIDSALTRSNWEVLLSLSRWAR